MKTSWKRWLALALCLALALSPVTPVLADEAQELPAEIESGEQASPMSITVGEYTPAMHGSENIRGGERYTLIALPLTWCEEYGDADVSTLTPAELVASTSQALFMGSALASADGQVTFEDVRLRTADAAVYYVTGPGLDQPLYEATSLSTQASGKVLTDSADSSASITLVDSETRYHYGNSVLTDKNGIFSFDSVAPGSYTARITKPGYLPYTQPVNIVDSRTTILNFNISSVNSGANNPAHYQVGDVDNNGARNMADLAAILRYYGQAAPQGITADLNADGNVDEADVKLLLTAAGMTKDITTGAAEGVTGAKVTVKDSGAAAAASPRSLSVGVETTATVSAAAFSITYRADAVQPMNAKGGLVSPVDGSSLASCLVPASGVAAQLISWQVAGETVTLSFALTCERAKAGGELAKFYYRPVSGSAEDLYAGAISLDHAVAVVGKDTVVTDSALTYPGQAGRAITSLTIDQQPAAGERVSLTIPAAGQTAALPLSATGHDGAQSYPELSGVTWSVSRADGESLEGVSVERSILTITTQATAGSVEVTASRDGVESAPLTVELKNAEPVATAILILKEGQAVTTDVAQGDGGSVTWCPQYTATVYDQYGMELAEQPEITWSLVGAPAWLTVENGLVTYAGEARSTGTWSFTVVAEAQGLQAALELELTLRASYLNIGGLVVAGPRRVAIPDEDEDPISYHYTVFALESDGRLRELSGEEVTFGRRSGGEAESGVDITREMDGSFTLTVSRQSPSISYDYEAVWYDADGEEVKTASFALERYARQTQTDAVQGAIFYQGEAVQSLHLSVPAGEAREFQFEGKMLDRDGAVAQDQPEGWYWERAFIEGQEDIRLDQGKLTVDATAKPGVYQYNVSLAERADEEGSAEIKYLYHLPITIEVLPQLSQLTLATPGRLTIPTQEELRYVLVTQAKDGDGNAMELPDDLVWTVTAKGGGQAPAGVSVADGALRVTPAAVPGDITVTVSDAAGKITASADIALAPGGTETSALALYRQITVDGKVVQKLEPVTTQGDALQTREGQRVEIAYTAMLVNRTTGVASPIRADQVKWLSGKSNFTVDTVTEPGVYAQNLTAVYGGQAVSAMASVEVFYDIVDLTLDFGDGKSAPPYEFTVPNRLSKTYTATVMAKIKRQGSAQTLPLRELELQNYDLSMGTALTGLYATVDKEAGTMTFTIDPAAVNNPTSAPTNGDYDVRFVELELDYFPGGEDYFDLDFFLIPDTTRVTQALLRRGVGQGVSFSFDSPKLDEVTTTQGTLTNCYAMELLDQYNLPVTNETVKWELTVPSALTHGEEEYVSIVDPGAHITGSYLRYASIRRLQIAPDAPVGSYELTLTATAAGFTCARTIFLTIVGNNDQDALTLEVMGSEMIVIPMYYARYNDTVLNNTVSTASYVAVLHDQNSGTDEEDLSNYNVTWSVSDPDGLAPVGVSVRESGGRGTVVVDRTAQPTGTQKNKLLKVTATVTLEDRVLSASIPVELSRDPAIPTLMRIRKNSAYVTSESVSMQSTDKTRTLEYTFDLVDQYNRPVEQQLLSQVKWELTGSTSGVAALQKIEQNGVTRARVTITNPGSRVNRTVYLTATINVAEPMAPGGIQAVSAQVNIAISIAGSDNGGGGGGGNTGGDDPGALTTAGEPKTMSISGNATVTTAQGTAASRTYAVVLRDKDGNTCALNEQQKVTWSATGLSGGLSFDSASHTLTVPANALVGTYTVHITARHTSGIQAAFNVTVTVTSKDEPQQEDQPGQNTTPTIVPAVTQSGSAGSATLTAEQEKALTEATATGGTVTVAPTGGSGLTSISVNLTAATVSALANQKNQSLKVQTALGTVVLPPAALKALAGQGGSTVTVKLSSAGGVIQADFVCGATAGTLPAAVTLSAPASGNLAIRVNGDGTETILKKAVVQNGKVLAYLNGSTQLKVENRSPAFTDTSDHWAREAITFTAARELFQGTSETTFAPNDTMTRSMLVTVLHRLEDTPAATATAQFADVVQGSWYTAAVDWANARGIVQGTDQGFQPGAPVTREQLATILYRYASTMGLTTSQRASLSGFSDRGKVSSWAQEAMQWAVGVGLINGKTGGVLDPTGNASRAEVSTILQRLIVYMAPTV